MRAIRAEAFEGYKSLKLINLPKPVAAEGRVLVRITAAGVTPLDHTILEGHLSSVATAPLVLGNEGAGVVEGGDDADFPDGSRVMFTGQIGFFEKGTFEEYVSVPKEYLCLIPDNVDDVAAASMPVAYLTSYLALKNAGFEAGKVVLAPAIGGSIGNATTQLARALGAKHSISSTTNKAKAEQALALGFSEVIDLTSEGLADGVRRITGDYGADIVVDGIGGNILTEALKILAQGGSLTTLGSAAGKNVNIDVTDLIWKVASIRSFLLFTESIAARNEAWAAITPLLKSGKIKPIVAKTFALADTAEAIRYLVEERPLGRVVVKV